MTASAPPRLEVSPLSCISGWQRTRNWSAEAALDTKTFTMEAIPAIEWIIVLESEDGKFWLDQASAKVPWPPHEPISVICPDAYRRLKELLNTEYTEYGFEEAILRAAIQEFSTHQELPDTRLQLVAVRPGKPAKPEHLFGLPVFDPDGDGPFALFIEHLEEIQLRKIRAQGHPTDYDALDLEDDLRSSANLSFVMGRDYHVEDELFEILAWHPFGHE